MLYVNVKWKRHLGCKPMEETKVCWKVETAGDEFVNIIRQIPLHFHWRSLPYIELSLLLLYIESIPCCCLLQLH